MSPSSLQLQLVSDLHLETPKSSPSYTTIDLDIQANYLCLLGDIGLVKDDGLFAFLRGTLEHHVGCRIFYIIGNHESYQLPYQEAVKRIREFESEAANKYSGQFKLLHRDRYDIDDTTTLLGCTLWSAISPEQASAACMRLNDFNPVHGIQGWSLDGYLSQHRQDLEWLNAQVLKIQAEEPHREIAILTHHSPTVDLRAIEPRYHGSEVSTCFATDMSDQPCWTSPKVKLWAVGHTHYDCAFRDGLAGKLVVTNQKGYGQRKVETVLVEVNAEEWKLVGSRDLQEPIAREDWLKAGDVESPRIKHVFESRGAKQSLFQRAAENLSIFKRYRK